MCTHVPVLQYEFESVYLHARACEYMMEKKWHGKEFFRRVMEKLMEQMIYCSIDELLKHNSREYEVSYSNRD